MTDKALEYLAGEDLDAYRKARDIQELDYLEKEAPEWRTTPEWGAAIDTMLYMRKTGEPVALSEKLSLDVFEVDESRAALRQYGNNLDRSYLLENGEFNYELWNQDRFILDVEQAYYENRGQIPLQFFMNHVEDLQLLLGDTDSVRKLAYQDTYQAEITAYDKMKRDRFFATADRIGSEADLTKSEAQSVWYNFPEIYAEFGDDDGAGQEALDERFGKGLNYGELRRLHLSTEGGESMDLSFRRAFGDGSAEGFLSGPIDVAHDMLKDVLGGVGGLFGGATAVAGQTVDMAFPEYTATIQQVGRWLGPDPQDATQQDIINGMREASNLDYDQFMVQAGSGMFLDSWLGLGDFGLDDAQRNYYLMMAGGNEDLARSFYVDEMIHMEENQAEALKQYELFQADIEYKIKELEDENFTTGDALLNVIAAWGEGIEFLATTATQSLKNVFVGQHSWFDAQFWQDVKDADTPAGVFGLEGTLVGLGLDLGLSVVMDPTTWIWGPRLQGARQGATTADDALRVSRHGMTTRSIQETYEAFVNTRTNAAGAWHLVDHLSETGMADMFLAHIPGFQRPIHGALEYVNAPIGKVTSNVPGSLIDDWLGTVRDVGPPSKSSAGMIIGEDGAVKFTTKMQPIEITYNPATKHYQMTGGVDTARALRSANVDSIPVTMKIDETFNVNTYQRVAGKSDEAAIAVNRIADGTFKEELRQSGRLVKEDRKAVEKLVQRGKDAAEHVPDEFDAIFGREAQELPSIANPKTLEPYKVVQVKTTGGNVDYLLYDVDGVPMGGVAVVDGQITMGLVDKARGTMGELWNLAERMGDDLLELHGASPSTSEAAADFAIRHAKSKLLDERFVRPIDDLPTAEWAGGVSVKETHKIDDALHVKPSRVLDDADLHPGLDMELMQDMIETHVKMGGEVQATNHTALSASIGSDIGYRMANSSVKTIAKNLAPYLQSVDSNVIMSLRGTGAVSRAVQTSVRMWSAVDDFAGLSPYIERVLHIRRAAGVAQTKFAATAAKRGQILRRIESLTADTAAAVDDVAQAKITKQLEDLQTQLGELDAVQRQLQVAADPTKQMSDVILEMMDDFNRKHIATNPNWTPDPKTGLVDWSEITGRGMTTSDQHLATVLRKAEAEGITVKEALAGERKAMPSEVIKSLEDAADILDEAIKNSQLSPQIFLQDALHALSQPGSVSLPISPLEAMMAAKGSKAHVQSVTAALLGDEAAQTAHKIHMYWALDKVFTPRTGVVVSLDEWLRIWQQGGTKSLFKYAEDKAIHMSETVAKALKKNPDLPAAWQERLVALQEYPIMFRQLERSFLETNGVGFDAIKVGDGMYLDAAQQWSGNWLSDVGFQKYMEGPEAFKKFVETDPRAAALREIEVLDVADKSRKVGMSADQAYAYYEMLYEKWALSKIPSKRLPEARKVWKEAAARAAEKGSTAAGPVALPDWVLEGWGVVTGNRSYPSSGMKIFNRISEGLFQSPLEYRRGFHAELVRTAERERLARLYASQNKKVISHAQFMELLNQKYPYMLDDTLTANLDTLSQRMFQEHGVLSQRFVDELVEAKVIREMDETLYSFQMNSRGGKAARAVAPFGKPWADMWAHWGREMLRRPALRGWVTNENLGKMGELAKQANDALPFNPKATGFVSRIAATDFDLDNIQNDPLVGELAQAVGLERLNISPGLFLPTQGENPFAVMLPGLGMVMSTVAGVAFDALAPDPVADPEGYQAWVDDWSQFIPSLGYGQGQGAVGFLGNMFLGGGTVTRGLQVANDIFAISGRDVNLTADPLNGSWQSRVVANREVKVLFQDPNIWSELAELPPELAELGVQALLSEKLQEIGKEATQAQGRASLKEHLSEFAVPVRATFDSASSELSEAWIDSIEWMGLEAPGYIDTSTTVGQRQMAEWARSRFFDLSNTERDAIVAKNPALAVNLVSMWEWAPGALNDATMAAETATPYRTGGSTADQKRHQTYLDKGLVQPITPVRLAQNIIGAVATAKANTANNLYIASATLVNDVRWETVVTPELKGALDATAKLFNERGILPYRTGKELWENYGDLTSVMDQIVPRDEDGNGFSIPTAQRAWGVAFPTSYDALREEYTEGFPLPTITDEIAQLADALGINLEDRALYTEDSPTLEMVEVYEAAARVMTEDVLENPVFASVAAGYQSYLAPRSAGLTATTTTLSKLFKNLSATGEAAVFEKKQALVWIAEAQRRKSLGDRSWTEVRDEAVNMFGRLFQNDGFNTQPVAQLWDQAWGKSLGEFDWTPDEPLLLFDDGGMNPAAEQIFVRNVIDGDTLDYSLAENGVYPGHQAYRLRILGWNAAELDNGGEAEKNDLTSLIRQAVETNQAIHIIPDERYGDVDMYGRRFAWLYIGEEPYYNADTMIPGSS